MGAFDHRGDLASLDEFHQTFVSSRTGTPQDVMIDCGGAILGLAICRRFWGTRVSVGRLRRHNIGSIQP